MDRYYGYKKYFNVDGYNTIEFYSTIEILSKYFGPPEKIDYNEKNVLKNTFSVRWLAFTPFKYNPYDINKLTKKEKKELDVILEEEWLLLDIASEIEFSLIEHQHLDTKSQMNFIITSKYDHDNDLILKLNKIIKDSNLSIPDEEIILKQNWEYFFNHKVKENYKDPKICEICGSGYYTPKCKFISLHTDGMKKLIDNRKYYWYDKFESIKDIGNIPSGTVMTMLDWSYNVGRQCYIDLERGSDKTWWKFHSYNNEMFNGSKNYNIRASHIFGSYKYDTFNLNKDKISDIDVLLIANKYFDSGDTNIHVYTKEQFQALLDKHDILALECYFNDENESEKIYENHIKNSGLLKFILDKTKLRTSISTIVSNSWVKGKKKLTISGDYDVWLGIKSIFHSLRILDYGIQIAQHSKIIDYKKMSYLLEDLIKLSKQYQSIELWEAINTKYRKLYNSMNTEFKTLAPKDLTEKDKKVQLEKVFKIYGLNNQDLIDKILAII